MQTLPKVGGFHHDLMNCVEKADVFRFVDKVMYEHGFYSATLYYGEEFVKDITFFPAHWSRKQVIDKIYEAYNNCIKVELRMGKYLIRGKTNEGVTIEMFITQKGHIVTAYPIFEGKVCKMPS